MQIAVFEDNGNAVRSALYVLVNFLLIIFFLCFDFHETSWQDVAGLVSIVHITVSLLFMRKCKIKLFSICGLFVIVLFVLHYGQIIVNVIPDYKFFKYNFLNFYEDSINIEAFVKTFLATMFVVAGVIWKADASRAISGDGLQELLQKQRLYERMNAYKKVALAFLVIFVPIRLYVDITRILVSIRLGYVEAITNSGVSYTMQTLSRLSIVGVCIMMYSLPVKSRSKKIVFIVSVLYLLVTMASGSRIHAIIDILLLTVTFLNTDKIKFRLKTFLIALFTLLLLATSLATAREARNSIEKDNVGQIFFRKLTTENVIVQEIEELGQTFYTCSVTVDYLKKHSYGRGKTYILGLALIAPNIGGFVNEIQNKADYTAVMKKAGIRGIYVHIGGSIIGEFIYNFKYLLPLMAFFLGLFVAVISNRFEKCINGNVAGFSFSWTVCSAIALLEMSRESFPAGIRVFVWGTIVCLVFHYIFYREPNACAATLFVRRIKTNE